MHNNTIDKAVYLITHNIARVHNTGPPRITLKVCCAVDNQEAQSVNPRPTLLLNHNIRTNTFIGGQHINNNVAFSANQSQSWPSYAPRLQSKNSPKPLTSPTMKGIHTPPGAHQIPTHTNRYYRDHQSTPPPDTHAQNPATHVGHVFLVATRNTIHHTNPMRGSQASGQTLEIIDQSRGRLVNYTPAKNSDKLHIAHIAHHRLTHTHHNSTPRNGHCPNNSKDVKHRETSTHTLATHAALATSGTQMQTEIQAHLPITHTTTNCTAGADFIKNDFVETTTSDDHCPPNLGLGPKSTVTPDLGTKSQESTAKFDSKQT